MATCIAYMIVLVALVYNCTCDKIYREYENDYAIPDITHGCGLLVMVLAAGRTRARVGE